MKLIFFTNMSESKHNLRSRKHLDYASINAGKSVQFPAYGFSPDPRPLQAPVGDYTPRGHQTHDFTETKRLLNKDHYGTLRGERKWLQHICARCWVDTRFVARHTEFSKECPLAAEKDSNSSGTAAP